MRKHLRTLETKLFCNAVEDAKLIETDQAEPFRQRPPSFSIVQPPELSEQPLCPHHPRQGGRSSKQLPVLKRKLNCWLRRYDEVLAFCSATRHDRGTGAL